MTTQVAQRFQKPDVLRMFPSFVWKAELRPEIHEPINDLILRTLAEIGAPLTDLKLGESWQSDHGLHELRQFGELIDCISEAAGSVLAYLKVGHEGLKVTGCWANLNAPGTGHPAHSHPNNYLSGVYYARVQPGADTINFLDPRPQTGIIRPPVTTLTAENTEQVVVKITCGTLLMFPAWLQHAVDPNRSDRLRVSIGFNIMFPAYAEVMTRPLWTPGRRPSGEPQSITRRRHRRQTTNVADLSVGANL
jgi:uncharacterized protein (TIGR02466 family)